MDMKVLILIRRVLWCVTLRIEKEFEKYKELKWISPKDELVDQYIITDHIPAFIMGLYKKEFTNDDIETVIKKAECHQNYAKWRQTADLIYIICDVLRLLNDYSKEELGDIYGSKGIVLEEYDNMLKIRDYFVRMLFPHQVYYQSERQYFNSQIIETIENDAELISKTVENVIEFVEAIREDDIEGLLQAKQKYISNLSEFTSKEQQEKIEELVQQIVEKIKTTIQKMDLYDDLYKSVSKEFLPYSGEMIQYPKILNSLVSAEYLYRQYIEKKEPKSSFDYSCISVMYYLSLEDFANKLVYSKYEIEVLSNIGLKSPYEKKWKENDYSDYVSSYDAFWDKKQNHLKKHAK